MSPAATESALLSDEDYLVSRAKRALTVDPYTAKAWMVTAKTLFPNNFAVQFEAYHIVKTAKNVKEAAKCFETLLEQFQDDAELWQEVEALTQALRSDGGEQEPAFLRSIFSHLSVEAQQQLLQVTADRCQDTMEHCRLLLLLLNRFPQAVTKHGPRLVDTLLTAEKHIPQQSAVNCYRKLLVCELVPLLGKGLGSVELPTRQVYRLLHKTIEFYLCCLTTNDASEEDPWGSLFQALASLGHMLGWELCAVFNKPWSRELFWQQLADRYEKQRRPADPDSVEVRQVVHCTTVFFLRCLHEYISGLNSGESQLTLLEAFTASTEVETLEPPAKRRKDDGRPVITVDTNVSGISASGCSPSSAGGNMTPNSAAGSRERNASAAPVIAHFTAALRCWDFINTADAVRRGVMKVLPSLGVDPWLSTFNLDVQLYRREFEDLVTVLLHGEAQTQDASQAQTQELKPSMENPQVHGHHLDQSTNQATCHGLSPGQITLMRNLRLASAFYSLRRTSLAVERALQVVSALNMLPHAGKLSGTLLHSKPQQRHLHLLPLARTPVLQYCIHLLLAIYKHSWLPRPVPMGPGAPGSSEQDLCVGHMLVLLQIELGSERPVFGAVDLLSSLLERIRTRTAFSYPLFTTYVISSDILEEIMHLSTKHGGSVTFDILPPSAQLASQRRISTRGVDKGAKEDFKSAMRRQMARSGEPLEPLLIKFLTNERNLILRLL